MKGSSKKLLLIFATLLAAIVIWFGALLYHFHYSPLLKSTTKSIAIKVVPGTSIKQLAQQLHNKKLIARPRFFISIARIKGLAKKLRFGEYWIKPNMSASDLLNNISHAKGIVRHHITFIEGWTFLQMKEALAKDPDIKHTITQKTNQDIMTQLGHPNQHPEGLFFPDTYYFTWGYSDINILKLAYNEMQKIINQRWPNRAKGLPYKTSYQALIVASLIEKESSIKNERPLIAGVILHRLRKGMRLQVDPTVLYGLNKPYGTTITGTDLRTKTPYNTYRVHGLPPTPIDMPSRSSIDAALHPEHTNYLYYVAKGNGGHIFSKNYRDHLTAVRKYKSFKRAQEEEDLQESSLKEQWEHKAMKVAEILIQLIEARI